MAKYYVLLPNKQRQSYNRAFMLLKDAAFSLGLTLDPTSPMCDFELAIIQASSLNFPNATHCGCYFHFMQAIWRKIQALVEEYKTGDSLKLFVQKITFCPLTFIRTAWIAVQQEPPQIDPQADSQIDSLIEYFDRTWMNGQFQPHQWNYYDYSGPCTNNHVEGWHSRLKKVVYRKATSKHF